jgi:cytochrome c-type protein NapB
MRKTIALALAFSLTAAALAAEFVDRTRGNLPIPEEGTPPPLVNSDNSDIRRQRAYAQQPPVIPHKVEGYQVDKNANRCLMCHGRTRTQESQAPMVSISHYLDRDGNTLAEISPRRYFCMQCHVPQVPTNPLVENRFTDVEAMLRRSGGKPAAPAR